MSQQPVVDDATVGADESLVWHAALVRLQVLMDT